MANEDISQRMTARKSIAAFLNHPLVDFIFILLTTLALIFLICVMVASSTHDKLPSFIISLVPPKGDQNLQDGIKCYGLPYGGIGFLSHILTYGTAIALYGHKSPVKALAKLACIPINDTELYHPWIDFSLSLVAVILTVSSSALSIVRCRNQWPLILIATWKMLLSISIGCTAIHRSLNVRNVKKRRDNFEIKRRKSSRRTRPPKDFPEHSKWPFVWIFIYMIGIVIGLVGLFAIIARNWPMRTKAMEAITIVFALLLLFPIIIGIIIGLCCGLFDEAKHWGFASGMFAGSFLILLTIGVISAFYSDWMLAAIEVNNGGSWAGLPAQDAKWLYWIYFSAKRLPMLAT